MILSTPSSLFTRQQKREVLTRVRLSNTLGRLCCLVSHKNLWGIWGGHCALCAWLTITRSPFDPQSLPYLPAFLFTQPFAALLIHHLSPSLPHSLTHPRTHPPIQWQLWQLATHPPVHPLHFLAQRAVAGERDREATQAPLQGLYPRKLPESPP